MFSNLKEIIDKLCLELWDLNEELYGQKYDEDE
jgi:hypothetical protein